MAILTVLVNPVSGLYDSRKLRVEVNRTSLKQATLLLWGAVAPRLPPLLPALALLLLPVLLVLRPILITPRGRADHGNQNRDRDNGEDNETDTGCYSDTQGKTSPCTLFRGCRTLRPDSPMLTKDPQKPGVSNEPHPCNCPSEASSSRQEVSLENGPGGAGKHPEARTTKG